MHQDASANSIRGNIELRSILPGEMILTHLFCSQLLTARRQGLGLLGVNAKDLQDDANPPHDLLDAIHIVFNRRGTRTVDELADAIVEDETTLPDIVPTSPSLVWAATRITAELRENHVS